MRSQRSYLLKIFNNIEKPSYYCDNPLRNLSRPAPNIFHILFQFVRRQITEYLRRPSGKSLRECWSFNLLFVLLVGVPRIFQLQWGADQKQEYCLVQIYTQREKNDRCSSSSCTCTCPGGTRNSKQIACPKSWIKTFIGGMLNISRIDRCSFPDPEFWEFWVEELARKGIIAVVAKNGGKNH